MKDLSRRRQARELALQVLFQRGFVIDLDINQSLDYFKGQLKPVDETYQYAHHLISGIFDNLNTIDEKIQSHAANWKLNRMAMVDLNILRIGVFELLFSGGSIPEKSSIDEAIELAKKYSTTDSSSFINGILDQVLKNR